MTDLQKLVERLARPCIAEDWSDHIPGYYRDMNLERFAQLVAEECAKVCEERSGMRGTGAWTALTAASDAIRERFGIKG